MARTLADRALDCLQPGPASTPPPTFGLCRLILSDMARTLADRALDCLQPGPANTP
ncbi:hypothetical protein [Pseudomonas sp. 31 R 17]|uniref:hypothetical protein n=1 Tax=Pseudomonas sp. 31 R 17 TaxID=1844101 RepID=UPI00210AFC2F|nr:hypothetical protein [Pseudomonas sp. 31 R 17]